MNNNTIIVYDLETSSSDARTADPLQLSSLAISPRDLKVIKNSEYNSYIRPDNFGPDYVEKNIKTFKWHADNQSMTVEEFAKLIDTAPSEKLVFENWLTYLSKYHTRVTSQNIHTAPILAGYNIITFDNPIIDRLCIKYNKVDKDKKQNLYKDSFCIDLIKIFQVWFENSDNLPDYKMDTLRKFFDISTANAHDGIKDCRDEADLLIRFLTLHRRMFKMVPTFNKKI
jgi:exonuclease I